MIRNWREKSVRELGRTANHIYLAPHPAFYGKVAHYTIWTAGGIADGGIPALTLVPDASGCIVIHLRQGQATGTVWGATTRAVTVDNSVQGPPVRLFIEFLPGGLFHLIGDCQRELTDGQFLLEEVMPGLWRDICRLLECCETTTQLAQGFDRLLLPILLARRLPPAVVLCMSSLKTSRGLLPVARLGEQACYSERHLNRLLGECLGMGPKVFARLLRVNAAIRTLETGQSLTNLAQEAGFYDQAHFIRDFKALCGVVPGFYRENLSDFYNEPYKF